VVRDPAVIEAYLGQRWLNRSMGAAEIAHRPMGDPGMAPQPSRQHGKAVLPLDPC